MEKDNKNLSFNDYVSRFNVFLKQRKLSHTSERNAILRAIYQFDKHFTLEELLNYLKKNKYYVSRSTLYNNINLLLEAGLIYKYQFSNQDLPCYEKCLKENVHNHIYNIKTQEVIEFSDHRIEDIIHEIEQKYNIKVLQHNFVAYCEDNNQ